MTTSFTTLPQVTIQPTYPSVLSDVASAIVPAEDIWISCYKEGSSTVHGKVRVSRDRDGPGGVKFEAKNGVQVEWINSAALKVSCPALHIEPTLVRFPRQVVPISPGIQITSFAPAPDLSLIATGSPSGSISITPLSAPGTALQPAQTFNAHLSTVLTVRVLPSSKVILSGGSDCQLQISPTEPPLVPARTLRAHKRGVTDTHVIDRGRQLLSCAKDGTVRLWDVPSGRTVRTTGLPDYSGANSMAGMTAAAKLDLSYLRPDAPAPQMNGSSPASTDEMPILAVALSSGLFTLLDLRASASSPTAFTSKRTESTTSSNALQSIAMSSTRIHTGSIKGTLTTYDLRNLGTPLHTIKRNGSSLEGLVVLDDGEVAVGTEDGLPYRLSFGAEPEVKEEWAGWECDAVRSVRVEGGSVWMAGDDGVVRRY